MWEYYLKGGKADVVFDGVCTSSINIKFKKCVIQQCLPGTALPEMV